MKRRSAEVQFQEKIELGQSGLSCRGYGKNGRFVCRLDINAAGVDVYAGPTGKRKIISLSWEKFVKHLDGAANSN
jgi:hypothetical protein